ncbi:MAG TPA: hypothetical protein VGR78_02295 [Verrucomicrobiae bacterium]|jgi:hypothetical protein|nr:hypothetical protein [Verrucomicrobiae bacterium]
MNTTILLSVLLFATSALAQDQTLERSKAATEADRQAQRKLEAERRATSPKQEQPIVLNGFLVDLSHAEKKSALLSLRQPADPKHDYQHVYLDERTARPKGFVLFSIGF